MAPARNAAEHVQIQICETAAVMLLDGGVDALLSATVAEAAGVTRSRLLRLYKGRAQLISGVYLHGHTRIATLCDRRAAHRAGSGVDAVVALTYDLIEQAAVDPLARVVHCVEGTEPALDTAVGSVYRLWHDRFRAMLAGGGELGSDPALADAIPADPTLVDLAGQRVVEVADMLVAAVAALCDPRRFSVTTVRERMDRMHIVLLAVIPALCRDTGRAEHMRQYLTRVHHHTVEYGLEHDAIAYTDAGQRAGT